MLIATIEYRYNFIGKTMFEYRKLIFCLNDFLKNNLNPKNVVD